jgi:catechol 2,3-dioxygenase-like lactoylglutathione lyase family enzyme
MNLNQVLIYSTKVAETVRFFQTLGLELIVDSLPRYARLACPDDGATISVNTIDEQPERGAVKLYFECDDLDARVAELKRQGIEFESEPVDQTWLWREAYLKDPNGNTICLYYAGENRLNPPWRVKS